MPAAQRYAFMHKYSTDEYSMEMGRAVDMWSQCALLVVCVVELNKTLAKLKVFMRLACVKCWILLYLLIYSVGFIVFTLILYVGLLYLLIYSLWVLLQAGTFIPPLSKNYVLRSIRSKVPPLLASASAFFVPPSLGYYAAGSAQQSVPLSAEALQKTQDLIHGFFQQYSEPTVGLISKSEIHDLSECMTVMNSIFTEVTILLKKALKLTYTELADVIPYGGRGCKEWVFALAGMGAKRTISHTQLSSASFDEEDLV